MLYIGIDNGTSGTISILEQEGRCLLHCLVPSFTELSYTKAKKNISRIDTKKLISLLQTYMPPGQNDCVVILERPMINPGRFAATLSAVRALEAVLIVLETLRLPYLYVDSKEWQKEMLPTGIFKIKKTKTGKDQFVSPGSAIVKKAACTIAKRRFPDVSTTDADSLLMAEYARRKQA